MRTTELVRARLRQVARELQEEFGPVGAGEEGCLLEAAEDWGVELGDELARAVMEQALPGASVEPEEAACPGCGRVTPRTGVRKRRLETRRGAIHVTEPEHRCPRCRRSFFPSDAGLGDGA